LLLLWIIIHSSYQLYNMSMKYMRKSNINISKSITISSWCRMCVAIFHSRNVSGKCEETINSCLLSVKKWNENRRLVFWSLETLIGFRDRVRGLVA
jgi:hypothetical protein